MALSAAESIQRLSDSPLLAIPESAPMPIDIINFDEKWSGERSAGNLHAAFDEAGPGDVGYGRNRNPLHN